MRRREFRLSGLFPAGRRHSSGGFCRAADAARRGRGAAGAFGEVLLFRSRAVEGLLPDKFYEGRPAPAPGARKKGRYSPFIFSSFSCLVLQSMHWVVTGRAINLFSEMSQPQEVQIP